MSRIIESLLKSGTKLTDASYSGKDDDGAQISRVDVSRSLATSDLLDDSAIVKAVAASSGGQLRFKGVNASIDNVGCAFAVNDLVGNILDEDAIDVALSVVGREEREESVVDENRQLDEIRSDIESRVVAKNAGSVRESVIAD